MASAGVAAPPLGAPVAVEEEPQALAAPGAKKDDNWRPAPEQPQPLREAFVQNAVNFLSHPKVKGSSVQHRLKFLETKGLTKDEIDEAFRRVPDPPSATTAIPLASRESAVSGAAPGYQVAPASQVGPLAQALPTQQQQLALAPKRPGWTQMVVAVGVLACAGAGTGVLVKRWLIPKLKNWIRRVALDETPEQKKAAQDDDAANVSAVTATAAAVAAAASEMAAATKEIVRSRVEEREYRNEFKNALDAQATSLKTAMTVVQEAMQNIEASRQFSPDSRDLLRDRVNTGSESFNWAARPAAATNFEAQYAARNSIVKSAKGGLTTELHRPSSGHHVQTANLLRGAGMHGPSRMDEVVAKLERGEPFPDIRAVDDKPPNPMQEPSSPKLQPRPKPWEVAASAALRSREPDTLSIGQSAMVSERLDATQWPTSSWAGGSVYEGPSTSWAAGSAAGITEQDSSMGAAAGRGKHTTEIGVRANSPGPVGKRWVPPPMPPSALPALVSSTQLDGERVESGVASSEVPTPVKQEPVDKFEAAVTIQAAGDSLGQAEAAPESDNPHENGGEGSA